MLNNKQMIISTFAIKDYRRNNILNNKSNSNNDSAHKSQSMSGKSFLNYFEQNQSDHKVSTNIRYNSNRKNKHGSADFTALPDIEGFNCTVSSCNDHSLMTTKGMMIAPKGFNYTQVNYYKDNNGKMKRRKNQGCLVKRGLGIDRKPNLIQFEKDINGSNDVDLRRIDRFTLSEIHRMNDKKDMYLSHVEDKRNQLRRIIILNAGDRKYREDLRRAYCPYYV